MNHITYFDAPPKYMRHMFAKEILAPIVAQIDFIETAPTEIDLAAAAKRTPAKPKFIGNPFVKKPEDVFSLFVSEPFFDMFLNQADGNWKGEWSGGNALPLRAADYALERVNKRLPYTDCSADQGDVERFIVLMSGAVCELNLHFFGNKQPTATYNCFTTTEHEAQPFGQDITRVTNKEYIIVHTLTGPDNRSVYVCYEFVFSFYIINAGKAFAPLRLFPSFVPREREGDPSEASVPEQQTRSPFDRRDCAVVDSALTYVMNVGKTTNNMNMIYQCSEIMRKLQHGLTFTDGDLTLIQACLTRYADDIPQLIAVNAQYRAHAAELLKDKEYIEATFLAKVAALLK